MNAVCRALLIISLMIVTARDSAASECLQSEVETHVQQQFAIYGPQSARHEYFGFIYLSNGMIGSAVTRSRPCANADKCVVDSSEAVRLIPRSAKVLGEWHTHPHDGSPSLSSDDVRGAHGNRHIHCYSTFYSTPSGEIYKWNAKQISVPIAMASRVQIGNYMAHGWVTTKSSASAAAL